VTKIFDPELSLERNSTRVTQETQIFERHWRHAACPHKIVERHTDCFISFVLIKPNSCYSRDSWASFSLVSSDKFGFK